MLGTNYVRKALETQAVGAGATVNFDFTEDIDGNDIPAQVKILRYVVHSSVATIFAFRIFDAETRVIDPTQADYSLVHEDTWTPLTVADDDPHIFEGEITYRDADSAVDAMSSTIWAQLQIQAGQAAATFAIELWFTR